MHQVSQEVQTPEGAVLVNGFYEPSFESVFAELKNNLIERVEAGAGVSVTFQGRTVVDL
jgi:hypothetical protein